MHKSVPNFKRCAIAPLQVTPLFSNMAARVPIGLCVCLCSNKARRILLSNCVFTESSRETPIFSICFFLYTLYMN